MTAVAAPPDRLGGLAALARPVWDINHVIAYGQSLAMGYEGWPALSLTQPHDSLMLGDSVRGAEETVPHWRPIGAAAFRPLVATVNEPGSATLLPPDAVARLPRENIAAGETVLEGAVNFWRRQQLAAGGRPGERRLLASAAGVGGRSIESLSRGAEPPLFNRFRDCVALARDTAAAAGLSYGVVAVLFLQGEHNALGAGGCTADRTTYRTLLAALHRDLVAEVAALTGQATPPGFFSYQTGGHYATAANAVAQAQLDFTLATPGCFMAGPSYPVTEKGGHLDANGYRWLGSQFGKVLHRVLTLGEDFLPPHPVRAARAGRRLQVAFHVPVPPLAWGQPFAGQNYYQPDDCGFAAFDAAGPLPLANVEQVAADTVELTLARDARGVVTLHYADATRRGRGSLHDSDPTEAADPYVYDPATGHFATANHPDLNGRPYRLRNWCPAFAIPVPVQPAIAPVAPAAPPVAPPFPAAAPRVAPVAAAVAPAAPVARSGAAWATLIERRGEVTGEKLPERHGWFARFIGRLLGRGSDARRRPKPPLRRDAPD